MAEKQVSLTEEQLRQLLADAAEAGATKALHAIGLHDEKAAVDVRELRGVLEAWRAAKSTALTTIVRTITIGFMAAIIAGLGLAMWNKH